jgi:hypothetical protein
MSDMNSDVSTSTGTVRGRWENGVAVYRGIPCAAPPVGGPGCEPLCLGHPVCPVLLLQSLPGGAHAFQDVLTTPTQRYHAIEGELRAGFYTDGRTFIKLNWVRIRAGP